jgi:MoaA/NifB/PqqE/SkfB family radical SAM enzyme|tara:strand:- start:11653 stop:12549 length:897 start_codon:yes stop_codon:yes gene_type:complete
MFKVEHLYPHIKQSVKVEWNLGKRCNYDCSYCPAVIHDNTSPHTDINILKNAVDELSKINNIRISFTGGEPCVHPKILDLLEYAKPKVSWLNVTTNGTRTAEFYIDILDRLINHIVFSVHFEYDYQKVIETVLNVAQHTKNKNILVHMMMLPGHLDDVSDACRRLKEAGINYALRPIRWTETHDVFEDMERYSADEKDFLVTQNHNPPHNTMIDETESCNTNDLLIAKTNQFKGWKCNAGLESLMINWDGEVHRATCRVGGPIGNIYEGTFAQPTEAINCTREWCTCAADINITKSKV